MSINYVIGVHIAAGAGMVKKTVSVGITTYIRTLLTLELGNSLLGRTSVKADLKKQNQMSAN